MSDGPSLLNVEELTKPTTTGTIADSGFPELAFPTFDLAGVASKINEQLQKAANLLTEGKKFYNETKLEEAAEVFSQATEILVDQSGYNAPETGEVCYWYGRTLMQLGRSQQEQQPVFGEAMTEAINANKEVILDLAKVKPEDLEGSDEESINSEEAEGEDGSEEEVEDGPEGEGEGGPEGKDGPEGEDGHEGEDGSEEGEGEESSGEEGNAEGASGEEGIDDPDNLAWELLEVARLALENGTSLKYQCLLSDVHVATGEMNIDAENWEGALEDFRTAIEIRQHAGAEPRSVAALLYTSALALGSIPPSANIETDFLGYFNQALDLLRQELVVAKTPEEAKEIQEFITEITERVTDINAMMNETPPVIEPGVEINPFTKQPKQASDDKPVTDLGVVKGKRPAPVMPGTGKVEASSKKRKATESLEDKDAKKKKPSQEDQDTKN